MSPEHKTLPMLDMSGSDMEVQYRIYLIGEDMVNPVVFPARL